MRQCIHPNLVQLHDYFKYAGRFYLVMDLVMAPGRAPDLNAWLNTPAPAGIGGRHPTEVEVAVVADRVASAVHYLNTELCCIHRDIKPENVSLAYHAHATSPI